MSTVQLGELVTIKGGGTPSRENPAYWGGSIPWASVKDFKTASISTTKETITEAGLRNSAANLIPAGAIIVPTRMAVGKAAINTIPVAINQDLKALLPKPGIEARFLLHLLLDRGPDIERRATGATVKGITLDVLRELEVVLPDEAEQKRIADILDEADALRAKRREALATLDEMARAIFTAMFGTLEPGATNYSSVPFDTIVSDSRIGLVRAATEVGAEHPHSYIKMDAITREGGLDLTRSTRTFATASEVADFSLADGDFLFNTRNSRELVGKSAIFRSDKTALFNNNLMRIRFRDGVEAEYVLAAMRTPALKQGLENRKSGTTSVYAIYWKDLRTLPVPLPPVEQQKAFAMRMKEVQKMRDVMRRAMDHLDSLFAALQHRAFRGEL
ncbi:restriction endonuclease subunit S [Roseococcus sp. DSY-14]|uniref:restriction endonuclease subunit S n=1 Tax=Roseococcus sp. DSY-14 TaxID=3369650 RepID=UPI00387B8C22